jgi:hypothetical protein
MASIEATSRNLTLVKAVPQTLEDLASFYLKDGELSLAEAPDDVIDRFINSYVDVTYEDNFESPLWSPDQRLAAFKDMEVLGIYPELYRETEVAECLK